MGLSAKIDMGLSLLGNDTFSFFEDGLGVGMAVSIDCTLSVG